MQVLNHLPIDLDALGRSLHQSSDVELPVANLADLASVVYRIREGSRLHDAVLAVNVSTEFTKHFI